MPTNAAATGFWSAMPGGSRANNARQGRALLQGVYQNNDTTPMNGTRSGVVPTTWDAANSRFTDLLVTVTSGLTMSVAPGSAVAHRSGQGPYEGWLLAAASVTCDPAPATNPRNDLIVMRWYDSAVGDTSPDGNPCRIEIITGTPGAVPVDPITANSLGVYTSFPTTGGGIGIPLARAQVSTGGVITLTRLRRSVGVIGATRALMEGDSDTAGNVGDTRYNPATDTFEVRDSAGNWQRVAFGDSVPRGKVAYGTSSTGSPANITTSDLMQAEVATGSVVSGRRYRISHIRSEAGGNILTNTYRVQAGGSITLGGSTVVKPTTDTTPGSYRTSTRFVFWVATFTGTATFGLSSRVNTGTNTVDGAVVREVLVEDIGV
ncbi:hypothetical protein [Amycolatopsis sp. NPDC052450]|uniref:hypothetical protein n=1 Tax=Amycolatopsis sp. NPDC052450 TaxID=3363937 RepID=UPI0037C8B211